MNETIYNFMKRSKGPKQREKWLMNFDGAY